MTKSRWYALAMAVAIALSLLVLGMRPTFIWTNVGIMLGYMYVGAFVAPHFKLDERDTKIAGTLFFVTCGLTHLEMALHAWLTPEESFLESMVTSWHGVLNHGVQVIAIWLFVTGLYRQFVIGPRLRT